METKENWDDLVFENRNREYGAYVMRKSYSKNVSGGVMITVGIAALVLIAPGVLSDIFGKETIAKVKDDIVICLLPIPPIEANQKPRIEMPKRRLTTASFVPVPVPFEPEVDEPEFAPDRSLPQDGAVTGADFVETTGQAVEPALPVVAPPKIYDFAEFMPQYKGGLAEMVKFVSKNVKYPHHAKLMGTEGIVFVQFVVDSEGHVTNVEVIRGISTDCDREAARVIANFPDWTPGKQGQNAVSVKMVLPVKFKIDN